MKKNFIVSTGILFFALLNTAQAQTAKDAYYVILEAKYKNDVLISQPLYYSKKCKKYKFYSDFKTMASIEFSKYLLSTPLYSVNVDYRTDIIDIIRNVKTNEAFGMQKSQEAWDTLKQREYDVRNEGKTPYRTEFEFDCYY